jgi:dienelactone hydrolase
MLNLTRRQLVGLPLAAALGAQSTRYPGIPYRDYSRCFPDFLTGLAEDAYRKRNAEIAKLTSLEAVRARQRWVRETFWRLAGGMPERTPLNARTVGGFERDGYRVERLVYESRPGLHVPANLYVPTKAKPPLPGVLFQMGHSNNGKAAEMYQKCCQGLARLGFLVLAFDPMGQGERIYYPGEKGASRVGGPTAEHDYAGRQMLLCGDTATRMQTWDAVRSLDYLAAHPLVDPARLASTGQSGGGTLTMFLAAVDDRLAAAAVSSGNTENFACANFNPPGSTDDAEQNFLYSGPAGFDRWDLLYPIAPKPLLVLVSAKDFIGTYSSNYIENGWEEFQKLKKVYEVMGQPESLAWDDTPLPHALGYYMRLRVYQWLVRWLMPGAPTVNEEPPVQVEQDETLWVAASGNVVKSFGGKTPFRLNLETAAKIATPERPARVAELLALPSHPASARILARRPAQGCETVALEVASAPRVWAPSYVYVPKAREEGKLALVLLEAGARGSRSTDGGLGQTLAREGILAAVTDVLGTGDLTAEYARGWTGYARGHAEEQEWAWACLTLGRPLLGQRVADVLATLRAVGEQEAARGRRIVLAARGRLTVPALFAAWLEPAVAVVYLAEGLVSFRAIVESESYNQAFANFVPWLLEHADLPQLAAALAPRRVILAGTVDAMGRPLKAEEVRRHYPGRHIEVRESAGWDVETLRAL